MTMSDTDTELDPTTQSADDALSDEVTASPPVLPEIADEAPPMVGPGVDLSLIAGVSMEVSVRLGTAQVPLRDLLAIGPGSVIELDRATDSPVEVLVNGTVVAFGEIVVVDGEFAVRILALNGKPAIS